MTFLRQIPTRRLLALCAVVVAVAALGTTVALAAGGGGSPPQQQSLAQAIHNALAAPAPAGVTARIRFTNHLLSGSGIGQGSDPLLNGASGRLWASDGHLRIELQSSGGAGDSQIVVNGRNVLVYDASANTALRAQLPAGGGRGGGGGGVPSVAQIQKTLSSLSQNLTITGPQSGTIAGQKSDAVTVSPKRNGGLLGSAEVAWDVAHGVPLRAAVSSKSVSPVLELTATSISYGPVSASTFAITPPSGTRVINVPLPSGGQARGTSVRGLPAVRARAGFAVSAPATLAGLQRNGVRLVSVAGRNAVLATYGAGPGGLAVVETTVPGANTLSGLPLPAVTINGAHGNVLQTALGTVVVFQRGGVTYVVAGSVPVATAEAAARAL
jgi:outer membrane lipoprotein-sorting protein